MRVGQGQSAKLGEMLLREKLNVTFMQIEIPQPGHNFSDGPLLQ